MHNTGCSVQDAVHRMHLTGCTTSTVFHMDVLLLHRMHCIGYNENDNVVIRYYNNQLNVYNENILLNMFILKVKLKANINLAFKNSEKHRQAITYYHSLYKCCCKIVHK